MHDLAPLAGRMRVRLTFIRGNAEGRKVFLIFGVRLIQRHAFSCHGDAGML